MKPPRAGSLYTDLPEPVAVEHFDELLTGEAFRLQRIVSTGQITPPGEWYDQDDDEWVVILQGAAEVRLADEPQARRLTPGDWLLLPAGCRHRVEWTTDDGPTVWLALHHTAAGGDR
ncbi:MAG: cupin [Gammaproteobacteria bacterium]|nr:MAG: cupin [Gammaproteobacteria bacterium]